MSITVENMKSEKVLERFTEVKRLAHFAEVGNFFNNCKEQLLNIRKWDKMMFLGNSSKIFLLDGYGYEVNRDAQKGDFIKVYFKDLIKIKNTFWFKIEELEAYEEDDSEEHISMILRESEDPTQKVNRLSVSLAGKCELTLRRLIQTVSIDAKVYKKQDLLNDINFINYFKWDRLLKNILSQL